ncbi:MAG: PPC domain-containing DNA-binding protein [Candidatus Brocadiia bacterium]
MKITGGMQVDEVICVGLEYGDDFHECVEQVAREMDIRSGVVLSGVGTFYKACIHYVTHTDFPSDDRYAELEGPIELVSVSGIIADYEPHMHCSMAIRGKEPFIGHLEPGCKILYLGEVVIARITGKVLLRRNHPHYGTPMLVAEENELD